MFTHALPRIQVLAFILIIAAATTQTQAPNGRIYSAAGWLLFVAVVALLIEVAIVAIRFLNLGLIEKYTLPLVITVSGLVWVKSDHPPCTL